MNRRNIFLNTDSTVRWDACGRERESPEWKRAWCWHSNFDGLRKNEAESTELRVAIGELRTRERQREGAETRKSGERAENSIHFSLNFSVKLS